MATEQQIADWKARKQLGADRPRFYFEVWFPRRDFDFAMFCAECYPEAVSFAQQTIEEAMEELDGESEASVIVKMRPGEPDSCAGAVCGHFADNGDDDGN